MRAALRPAARRRVPGLLLVVVLLLSAVPVVTGGDTADAQSLEEIRRRLGDVRSEQSAIEERLERATQAFDDLETRIGELEADQDELRRELRTVRRRLDEIDLLVTFRVRETFKHGTSLDPIAVFLSSDDPGAALSRAQTVQRFVAADQARSEQLLAVRARAAATEDRLAARTRELEAARDQQVRLGEELQADFQRLQDLEEGLTRQERAEVARLERLRREREERERRERAAAAAAAAARTAATTPRASGPAPTASGGMVCPLDRPRSFTNSWGAPRSGGRGHRGTDIMGPHGIPVRAITSGVWMHQRRGASAGIWGILRGDNGHHYWYMHLASHSVSSGSRVSAGQQVGTNGTTGNAPPNAPHVHFELHPGGGSAVNPYSLLRGVCG